MTSGTLLGLGVWVAAFAGFLPVLLWVARHQIDTVWMRGPIRTEGRSAPRPTERLVNNVSRRWVTKMLA
jgi:hypothetical protein